MIVVIDANLLIVLVNGDERGEAVAAKFAEWIEQGNAGLSQDSVALCFQMRVLDKNRLMRKLGQ